LVQPSSWLSKCVVIKVVGSEVASEGTAKDQVPTEQAEQEAGQCSDGEIEPVERARPGLLECVKLSVNDKKKYGYRQNEERDGVGNDEARTSLFNPAEVYIVPVNLSWGDAKGCPKHQPPQTDRKNHRSAARRKNRSLSFSGFSISSGFIVVSMSNSVETCV